MQLPTRKKIVLFWCEKKRRNFTFFFIYHPRFVLNSKYKNTSKKIFFRFIPAHPAVRKTIFVRGMKKNKEKQVNKQVAKFRKSEETAKY